MSETPSLAERKPIPNAKAVQLQQSLTLTKRIGKGRLGTVYAAVHEVLARRFAVKVLRAALTKGEETRRRLRHAVREISTIDHPNVVGLTDFGTLSDGRCYLTMDFVRGMQLTKVLERDGRFPVARVLPLLAQLADGLEAAHRYRIVHGDLKPNNILLEERPRGAEWLRIHDHSLTAVLSTPGSDHDPMQHLRLYGNLDYLAPEQLTVGSIVDGRADIYAFGAVAYRMVTGEPPFVGEAEEVLEAHRKLDPVPPSRRSGAEDVPPELDKLLLRCLEKAPADRFNSMEEVSVELRALLPQEEPEAFEEEDTGRWQLPEELELEEPLPESPGRLRQLFYDTIYELAQHIEQQGAATEDMSVEIAAARRVREEVAALSARCSLTENRFEDIRRELRERESTLRYAIIDLNLAKGEQREGNPGDLEHQIGELERSLAQVEQERRERFAALNDELQQAKEGLKALEQQMALHYRRLYAELDEVRINVETAEADRLFRLLSRCRNALSRK